MNKLKAKTEVLQRLLGVAGIDVSTKVIGSTVSIQLLIGDDQLTLRGRIPFGHDHKGAAYKEMVRGAKTYVHLVKPAIQTATLSQLAGPFKKGDYWEGVVTDALATIKEDVLGTPPF
tara:strand:- start:90 stop:440 length:351 start_codon:yes stop_codon:yes gene_type:complete